MPANNFDGKFLLDTWYGYKDIANEAHKGILQCIIQNSRTICRKKKYFFADILDPQDFLSPFLNQMGLEKIIDNLKTDKQKLWVLKSLDQSRIKAMQDITNMLNRMKEEPKTKKEEKRIAGVLGNAEQKILEKSWRHLFLTYIKTEYDYSDFLQGFIFKRYYHENIKEIRQFECAWFDVLSRDKLKIIAEFQKPYIMAEHSRIQEKNLNHPCLPKHRQQSIDQKKRKRKEWETCLKSVLEEEEEKEDTMSWQIRSLTRKRKTASLEKEKGTLEEMKKMKNII